MHIPPKVYVVVEKEACYDECTNKITDEVYIFQHRSEIMEKFPVIGDEFRLANIIAGKCSGKRNRTNKELTEFTRRHIIMQISIVSDYIYSEQIQKAIDHFINNYVSQRTL